MIKQICINCGLRKLIFYQFIVFSLAIINSCSTGKTFDLENHLGLYKLVDKKCSVVDNAFNPCDSTLFIELVKGQFIGIKDSDIAYVFWSGDPIIDPELQYTAQLIKNISTSKLVDNKFWLTDNSNTQEYLGFSKGKLDHYYLKYISGNGNKKTPRIIEYTLVPAMRSSEPRFRLNYPGNN